MSEPTNNLILEAMETVRSMPGSEAILEDLKNGNLSPLQATKKLMSIAIKEGQVKSLAVSYNKVKESVESENSRVWMDHSNGKRILNPIIHASITERAALDGDVPEYRFGPLREGETPAVPVSTNSLNSVVVGMQLERASEEVKTLIETEVENHWKEIEEKSTEERSLLPAKSVSTPTGIKGYESGKVASLRETKEPGVVEISALTERQKSQYIFMALSTTQGRVSGSHAIELNLKKRMESRGFTVSDSSLPNTKTFDWSSRCLGEEEINPNWDPINSAYSIMCAELDKICKKGVPTSVEVVPISGIADRIFGWKLIVGVEE